MHNAFLIAAPMSGSGKTTVARGLMALMRRKGLRVQPMKCGPDYIDTKFHAAVCGRPSINLDTFMSTPSEVRLLAERYAAQADVCIVEGMMGLFDGYRREQGSSYEIARLLKLPVVLVVDARSAAWSMAALLKGFLSFKDDIQFAGVIFNKVGSERHQQMLREVCQELSIRCLGCIPKNKAAETGERYLGLDFSHGAADSPSMFNELADLMEQHTDWQALMPQPTEQEPKEQQATPTAPHNQPIKRIAIARSDEAFSFIYQTTLDAMKGAEICFFNPERNETFPSDTDLLYLPGGYPEKHAECLAKAEATKACVRTFAEKGGRIIAECGGMMFLCEQILSDEGCHPMCGVLPYSVSARKQDRHLSLGYRSWTINGKSYRGHEFHYSQFVGTPPPTATKVCDARGNTVPCPIIRQGNVTASYTHWFVHSAEELLV